VAEDGVGTAVDSARLGARTAVRRLALSRIVSISGTYAASIALAYSIYRQTRSPGWVTATMVLTLGVVGFFGPAAGAISDRYDRRRVMILAELGAAGCWSVMAVVADEPALLLGLALFASLSEALFIPASGAAIPNLAGEDNLAWANSLIAIGRYAGLTVGPLTGGVLFAAVGPRWVFALNALSFFVSAGLVMGVRGSFADPARPPTLAEHGGLAAGSGSSQANRCSVRCSRHGWSSCLELRRRSWRNPCSPTTSEPAPSDTERSPPAGAGARSSGRGSPGACVGIERCCG
jgi:MFS family permease